MIKNCPCCGGKAETHSCLMIENSKLTYNGQFGVHCNDCHLSTMPFPSEEEAIENWNRRINDG